MLALLALPNTKQQSWEYTSQTRYKGKDGQAAFEGPGTRSHLRTTHKENRGRPGELEEAFSKRFCL
ncbi:hypothetical protein EYF80_010600 [Liparis tanakae]|uniref:Uncharacterized protein n=1 Tax=Liparis tanakae TaxID=230148 RepID=A0A4Z2IPL4_9TELE|nr:hypothetical protein EYF80_010600 [Liparis tanakae]